MIDLIPRVCRSAIATVIVYLGPDASFNVARLPRGRAL